MGVDMKRVFCPEVFRAVLREEPHQIALVALRTYHQAQCLFPGTVSTGDTVSRLWRSAVLVSVLARATEGGRD